MKPYLAPRTCRLIILNFIIHKRWKAEQANNLTYWMNLGSDSPSKKRRALIGDKNELKYEDLGRIVGRNAAFLRDCLSISRGDRVLARVSKSVETLALYLATLELGAIYIPVNPSYTHREMEHFVKDSEPKLLVTCANDGDKHFKKDVENVLEASTVIMEAEKQNPIYHVEPVEEQDTACICYTSGTTGLPKGAMLSHGNLIWNARALIALWRFTKDDILLHCLPFYHVHGMLISLNCSFLSSSSVIFRPKYDVDDVIRYLPKSTVMMGVPTYYSRLLQNKAFSKEVTKNMRLFVSGSAPMSASLWQEFRDRTGHCILERYGMTEAAVITSNLYEDKDRIPGTVGKILPGGEVKIWTMRLSSKNIVEIRLPSVFRGYWKKPEKTKAEFTSDGFFITGDLGYIDDNGYLQILGREKDLIITGGLNVYPKEIEDVLDNEDFIAESAVIGVPHPDFGEAVVAVCIPKSCSVLEAQNRSNELLVRAREKLANYKLPKHFVFLQVMPRNSMGKIQKNLLRKQYSNLFV